MSEQCRDWTRIENPGQSVGWRCNTHGDGYYVGDRSPYLCRAGRGAETVHILTDLIADLRGRHADCTTCYTKRALDRAEARLEEVQGE